MTSLNQGGVSRRASLLQALIMSVLAAGAAVVLSHAIQHRSSRGSEAVRVGTRETAGRAPADARPRASRPAGMPGEFEPQGALILACDELVRDHPPIFRAVAAAIHRNVHLICMASDENVRRSTAELLTLAGVPMEAVSFVRVAQETMWVRDYGPMFVRLADGGTAVVDPDRTSRSSHRDAEVPAVMSEMLGLPRIITPMAIEGGNLVTNGEGLCVTTTRGVSGDEGWNREEAAGMLRHHFGFRRWIFLEPPEWQEAFHVDMFVTFLAPNVVVVARADARKDPENARIFDEAAELLAREKTSLGPMQVHRVPMPGNRDGFYCTYTNVIMANGVLLVPVYTHADAGMQREVLALFARLMPGWKVVGIDADALVSLGGALRCMSMNVPAFAGMPKLPRELAVPRGGAVSLEELPENTVPAAAFSEARAKVLLGPAPLERVGTGGEHFR